MLMIIIFIINTSITVNISVHMNIVLAPMFMFILRLIDININFFTSAIKSTFILILTTIFITNPSGFMECSLNHSSKPRMIEGTFIEKKGLLKESGCA